MFCLVFFGFLWFSLYFWFARGIFWFCKNLRENQTKKKTYPRVSLKPLKTCFLGLFLMSFGFSLVFVGFLLYFWFSRGICWFCKDLRENPPKKTYPRVSLKPLKTLVVLFFLMCFWFSLVFFSSCGFLEGFVGFVKKPSGKPKKTKKQKKHIQG